jgi:hypothetical protein|tara:strand:+ start:8826 stop:9713 length:888 start_codon:yes stop_codon:yes gene_type:complete
MMKKQTKLYSGGTEVGVRIRYTRSAKLGQSGGSGVWSYYDELSTSPTDTVKAMGEKWSNFNQPIALSHEEKWENSGEHAYDRLMENRSFAEDDLADELNEVYWGVSGGDGNKLPTPITDVISGSDALTLYGLAKASNTWLYSQEITSVGDLESELIDKIREAELLAIDNSPNKSDKITAWVTHRSVYLGLENTLPQYVQVESTKAADLGFDSIKINKVDVGWDSDTPLDSNQDYQMYGLMTKYWEVGKRRQANFKVTPFVDMMPKQAADVAQLLDSEALVCNNPRTNVRIANIQL